MQKLGVVCGVMGPQKSSASFDRAHIASYLTSIEICVYLVPFSSYRELSVEMWPSLTYPTGVWHPQEGSRLISPWSLTSENLSPWAIVPCCLRDLKLAVLIQYRRVTDRQTDKRMTILASIASCSKSYWIDSNQILIDDKDLQVL